MGAAAANEKEGLREGTRVGARSLARSWHGCPRSLSVVSRTRGSGLRLPGPTEGGAAVPGVRGGPPKETPHAGRACAGRGTLPEPPPAVRPQLPASRWDAVRPWRFPLRGSGAAVLGTAGKETGLPGHVHRCPRVRLGSLRPLQHACGKVECNVFLGMVSAELGSAGLTFGLTDIGGLFQTKRFCDRTA